MMNWLSKTIALGAVAMYGSVALADEPSEVSFDVTGYYESDIKPILVEHCYDCHGYGEAEGNFVLDQFQTADDAMAEPHLWWRVTKNLRAGVMPPVESSTLTDEERRKISEWVKFGPFKIDPLNIDPGPVAIRRLNRDQYGNTIRQLMGIPFDEKLLFPPDDSGHGFDNVADALMVSPLLLDKYLQAAEAVVEQAVPKQTWIVPRIVLEGADFRSTEPNERGRNGRNLDGKKTASVQGKLSVDEAGIYDVRITVRQHGSFEFDPARYQVICYIDGQERFHVELGWDENKRTEFSYEEDWAAGQHAISIELRPNESDSDDSESMPENSDTSVSFQIQSVVVTGPQGTERRVHPDNYDRFFTLDEPPVDPNERRAYAIEVLKRFAVRAFRGNVEQATLSRLVHIAESSYQQPSTTFEAGIGRAMVAALVSPKFLFRIDSIDPKDLGQPFAKVDEISLAARLSYFLWSSIPDEELFELAQGQKLREELPAQVDRMLADPKSDAFITNFVGQWLRTRDVVNVAVDPAVILGVAEEYEQLREWSRNRFRRGFGRPLGRGEMSDEDKAKSERFRELRMLIERFDGDLKQAIQQETELFVKHVIQTDANLLDLLDCDYTFLNEKLAQHYGIPDVNGPEMRLVKLPSESVRGGVLTQASMLLVTSNPTRTSPVKRGLFVLDNILGTPAPPAPGVVPELEESANRFEDHEPTLRELLEVHRENALCASCHARMDPIGFALENFDALGMWRDRDGQALIESQGQLVTGETFDDITSLKKLLRERHSQDFYRCVTEKLLVFAIGRGVEYTDEHTIDQIVKELDEKGGTFRSLVHAVVRSAPFQLQRISSPASRSVAVDR